MRSNEYHFLTRWRVEATAEEVFDVLEKPLDLVRWWPFYLDVKEIEPDVHEFYARGWLPYSMRWRMRRTKLHRPTGFSLEAWGDFEGIGVWSFAQDGNYVDITYDWRIKGEKLLLRTLSFLLRPIFAANHNWVMAQGERSLKQELLRRKALQASVDPAGLTQSR